MRTRTAFARVTGWLVPLSMGTLAAACSDSFDTSRTLPPRGTLGQELFGVVCDRIGGQALHEDLTGASYEAMCQPASDGSYSSTVDQTQLPPMTDGQVDVNGDPVPLAKQQSDRAYGVARMQTLATHRTDLITAFDATFPDIQIAIKDVGNPDPTQSCNPPAASGEGSLHTELTNLLARFQDLYNDGTMPQTTESIGRVVDAFKAATDAQAAWAVFDARAGYRPIDINLGAARPTVAYPQLRDFSNATLALLSVDSQPYQLDPQYDSSGNRIPVPGAAYPQLSQLLSVAHAELFNSTPDAPLALLTTTPDMTTGAVVLSRPRGDLEFLQTILYAQDPTFGGGTSAYIVQRDPRGYVSVPLVNGKVPAPFVDANGDGLPDVDGTGAFQTSNGTPAPSPFFAVGAPDALARDTFSRALSAPGGPLLYGYIDTSHTYSATLMKNLQPLVDATVADNHETLMDFLSGAYVLFGTRSGSGKTTSATKTYADGESIAYDAFNTQSSPVIDFIYALGQILADPSADATLSFASSFVGQNPNAAARLVGDGLYAKGLADANTTAHIPPTSVLWDEMIDVAIQIDQEPGLLADVLRALGADASLPLSQAFSGYMANLDRISYDRTSLNGPAYNFNTSNTSAPMTAVNRASADTGVNRSEMQRFLQAIHDTHGVTACNKQGAVVHALNVSIPIIGSENIDIPYGANNEALVAVLLSTNYGSKQTFNECEVFKIDDLAAFYLDSIIGNASVYFRDNFVRNGSLGGLGAATVGLIENSSYIGYDPNSADTYNGADPTLPGFWDDSTSKTFRPKPAWLDRLVFFDIANDSPMQGQTNYNTNHFLTDLQGADIGTAICPERVIADPCVSTGSTCAGAPDIASDGNIHGLRACPANDWLFPRDQDATFVWEDLGFYNAITPLVSAFATAPNPTTGQPRHREDLFIALMEVLHKHWQTAQGTADECTLYQTGANPPPGPPAPVPNCTKEGADSYETLLAQIFSSDMLTALHDTVKILQGMSVPTCAATDPTTHTCTKAGPTEDGVTVLANAADALMNPARAKANGLKDRQGSVTSLRNDGTTNAQVTPLYLVLETLDEIDAAFAAYAQANPNDNQRQAQWKLARSQLVDQFLSVNGENTTMQTFVDPTLPKILPQIVDTVRSQLWSYCPPGSTSCPWATTTLSTNAGTTIGGPTFAGVVDVTEAIRQNTTGRTSTEQLLGYLMNAGSSNEALAELLASSDDIVQVMRDDANLVPLYHVLAAAALPTTTDAQGNVQRGVLDATTALLARTSGRAYDSSNTEICANELDPDGVLPIALANLVTPMKGTGGQVGETPLEVILDAVGDVNRASPGVATPMTGPDLANVSNEVSEFLLDDTRGLEQFYAIVRNGTVN